MIRKERRRRNECRIEFRLSVKDRELLELISETYGVSLSGAMRAAIRGTAEQLGLRPRG